MPGGRIGGQGGPIKRVAWTFFAACLVVALMGDLPRDPKAIMGELAAKSEQLKTLTADVVDWLGLSTDGSAPTWPKGSKSGGDGDGGGDGGSRDGDGGGTTGNSGTGTNASTGGTGSTGSGGAAATRTALNDLTVTTTRLTGYNRDQWRHWDNLTPCWTVREQVLYRDARPGTLTLLDRNGRRTTDKATACEVAGGEWVDPYTRQVFTNPSDLDIDHMVALGNAAASGGQAWSEDKKRTYANALGYHRHLWAVSASANRSKGDRTPAEWQPINRGIHCQYATAWITVKHNWHLTITPAEKQALADMLGTC